MTHDRILIATDNSDPARRATAEAITLAEAFDATLYALYVLETAESPPWFEDPALEPGLDTNAGQALNRVISEADDRGLESDVVTAVVRG
jgi:nucleotide-binding universal stress UspA family protein